MGDYYERRWAPEPHESTRRYDSYREGRRGEDGRALPRSRANDETNGGSHERRGSSSRPSMQNFNRPNQWLSEEYKKTQQMQSPRKTSAPSATFAEDSPHKKRVFSTSNWSEQEQPSKTATQPNIRGQNGTSINQRDSAKRTSSANAVENGESDQRQKSGEVDEAASKVMAQPATQLNSNDTMEVEQGSEPESSTTEPFAQENGKRVSTCASAL